jgi:hypothetical protein
VLLLNFELKKQNVKKYKNWRLKIKKINNWGVNLKKKFSKIFKKKFKSLFKKIRKNKFYFKRTIRKPQIIKKSKLFFNLLIIKTKPSNYFNSKIKKKMSLFLNYHPFIKFVLKKTFKNIKIFNIVKTKKKTFNVATGFKYAKYLKFEKNNNHLWLRFSKDVIIKRIKFKNNYIKIWKNARFVFKNFYNMSYKYQKQLTRRMFNYSRPSYNNFLIAFLSIKNVLEAILNKTLNASVTWLIKSGFVFINGASCNKKTKVLILNDKISLIVYKTFFKLFNFFSLNIFERKKKIFKWFVYIFKRVKFNFFKSKKTHLSKKYISYFNLKRDVPNFIEFDFISLSGFVLYSDLLLKNVIKHEYSKFNMYIYKNYNWKFIT